MAIAEVRRGPLAGRNLPFVYHPKLTSLDCFPLWDISMLDRISVNALLKSVIATLAMAVVIVLSLGAWQSWTRLNAVKRIAGVADASAHMFAALHNLRSDRTRTVRFLRADAQQATLDASLRQVREAEMPALRGAMNALEAMDFPERQTVVSDLGQRIKKLAALHEESAAALARHKAERRQGLEQEFFGHTNALIEMLDKLSSRMNQLVKLEDGFVDQLFDLKQLAWIVRDAGGDASVMVSNALSGQPLPPDALSKYAAHVSKLETAWAMLEERAASLTMPAAFTQAVDKAKREYFGRDYTDMRTNILKALVAGQKPGITMEQWSPLSVPRLATLLGVAEVALDVAKNHAENQRSTALWHLVIQIALLTAALLLAGGMMWVVSRRVSGPLHMLQEATLKLAGGDLSAQVSFAGRTDEIGALGSAMQVFKDSMIEADRLRAEQKEAEARATGPAQGRNEEAGGRIPGRGRPHRRCRLDRLGAARGGGRNARQDGREHAAALRRGGDGVGGGLRQRPVGRERRRGDDRVGRRDRPAGSGIEPDRGRSRAAGRQDRCPHHRTVERGKPHRRRRQADHRDRRADQPAGAERDDRGGARRRSGQGIRSGGAGVKALAAQTAKATDEIGTQISSMQSATHDSVAAIKEIGGTIGRIAEIAAAIAAAVEEQGAATQEISRNVQQASHGTTQVATNIVDVNRGAGETGSASSQVLASAQSLARESSHLKVEVEKFVTTVRAA
jgi:methyl-accepting chemotaxis protein